MDARHNALWLCRCDCGNERVVVLAKLRRGEAKSCGCARGRNLIDIAGQRFGQLVAIRRVGSDGRLTSQWLCRCDCGRESIALLDNLKRGRTKSCGCGRTGPRSRA
jgi:hypothetical protein